MNNMKHKILSLLVLLLTAATGAWAQTTVTWGTDELRSIKVVDAKVYDAYPVLANNGYSKESVTINGITLSCYYVGEHDLFDAGYSGSRAEYNDPTQYNYGGGLSMVCSDFFDQNKKKGNFVFSCAEDLFITKMVIVCPNCSTYVAIPDGTCEVEGSTSFDGGGCTITWTGASQKIPFDCNIQISSIEFTLGSPISVEWNASTQTGTFTMVDNNVVLTPIYASAATIDEAKKPKAVEDDIFAETTTKLVEGGETSEGTLMYILTSSDQAPTSTEGFSADVPTAENITEPGTYYVWYYIAGDDTHSDSEIMDPIAIKILSNKFTLTLSPAPVENVTVTVDGTAATPDSEGKIAEVKATKQVKLKAKDGYKFKKVVVKKAVAGKTITIPSRIGDPVTLVYADGDTWSTIIEKNSDKIRKAGIDSIDYNGCPLVDLTANKYVKTSEPIDPTHSYKFDNEWSAN